ncbi:MAG: hypothetical protein DMF74_12455 [Acidobacteria bacterium]|nr:MAG: hypothetical protein DMF74_12455 [Acidobacteriota bacterium]
MWQRLHSSRHHQSRGDHARSFQAGSCLILRVSQETFDLPKANSAQDHQRWRVRVGDYRVIYTIDDSFHLVEIIAVRHRSKAYD